MPGKSQLCNNAQWNIDVWDNWACEMLFCNCSLAIIVMNQRGVWD